MKGKKTRAGSQLSTGGYPQAVAALMDVPLPAYVCAQAWSDFVAMRAEQGAPLTRRAALLVVKRLMAMHGEGYCPTAALEKSVRCGWRDVYPGQRLAPVEVEPTVEVVHGVRMPSAVRDRLARLGLQVGD